MHTYRFFYIKIFLFLYIYVVVVEAHLYICLYTCIFPPFLSTLACSLHWHVGQVNGVFRELFELHLIGVCIRCALLS